MHYMCYSRSKSKEDIPLSEENPKKCLRKWYDPSLHPSLVIETKMLFYCNFDATAQSNMGFIL